MFKLAYKDILHTKQFSKKDLELIFSTAKDMEKILSWEKKETPLKGKIMASMFYEPSTRTRLSFECAMKRLWWETITVAEWKTTSFAKWETIEDNAKMLAMYSDIVVMRHPESYSVDKTADVVDKPVINAWDWARQHPTQALLDVYTILKEKWRLDNLNIAVAWDLKYSRTIHSLVFLTGLYEDIKFTFISPEELEMPRKVIKFLEENNIKFKKTRDYKNWIKWCDILYTNRIQQERFPDKSEFLALKDKYILWLDILDWNKDITIMNPLPRINEIKKEIDFLPNAAYFRQASNWIPIRMALLYLLLKD